MYRTPKRNKILVDNDDLINITPPNRGLTPKLFNSLDKGLVNGCSSNTENSVLSPGETRRGRPRNELLNTLILEGSTSPSSIKCSYCSRVFPREKSLQAHLRTHTGEKPYVCDYPRCTRKFAQSGQLKTHQRLHTGEKPFVCASPNCDRRFTHANRHCPEHPELTLKRFSENSSNIEKKFDEEHNAEIRQWLLNIDRRNKRNGENLETTPKKSRFKSETSYNSSSSYYSTPPQQNSGDDLENSPNSDNDISTCSNTDSLEGEVQDSSSSPRMPYLELPKKRWLREAVQNQQLWDQNQDLARPINWGETDDIKKEIDDEIRTTTTTTIIQQQSQIVVDQNQKRPSVLVCVQGGKSKQITSDDMQGAIALVELKNGHTQNINNFNYRI